jgi:hypothetical protein
MCARSRTSQTLAGSFGTRPIRNTIGGAGGLVGVSNLRNSGSGAVVVLLSVALLATAAACGSDPPSPVSLFSVPGGPRPPTEFYELPFPNDIRRGADGRPDLADYPRLNPTVDRFPAAISANLDGFGLNTAIFVRFGGPVDAASLPQEPEASLMDDASVYLVNIDPTGPGRGGKTPLLFRFEPRPGSVIGGNWLSALPYPGFPLDEGATYALVVTRRVTIGGVAALPSDDFTAIAASDKPGDAALAAAQATYQPLWDYLDQPGGDDRADVVNAAVFTTQHATDIMALLRRKVRSLPAPAATGVVRYRSSAYWIMYDGTFASPNFQVGDPPYTETGGEIQLGTDGLPVVQRMEPLRFSFAIPRTTPPPAGWPVVIADTGTGSTYHSYYDTNLVDVMTDAGLAVISIDPVLSGDRNIDGNPQFDFYNFENPQPSRNNTIQGATDNFSIVRLLQDFSFTEPPAGSDPGRTIRFDPANISLFGHSQGGLTGAPFLAFEPDVKAAVLSGTGALLFEVLLGKTLPIDISAVTATFIPDDPLDEFNPVLAMLQTWVERSESANYAPLIARAPITGDDGQTLAPKDVYQSEGIVDHWVPNRGIQAFATALGGNQIAAFDGTMPWPAVKGLELRGRDQLVTPVSGNLAGKTVVLVQYRQRTGSDGHFVASDVPAAVWTWSEFLRTRATTGVATLVP